MQFPVERLKINDVEFSSSGGMVSITLKLAPFTYFDGEAEATQETSVSLPDIELGGRVSGQLVGQTLEFPTNPEPGFIDGSMCIQHAQHPVDVAKIAFSESSGAGIRAKFYTILVLGYEGLGDYQDTAWSFEIEVPEDVLTAAR